MEKKFIDWMNEVNGEKVIISDVASEDILGDGLDDILQGVVHYTNAGKDYYSYDGKGFKFESTHGW